ncbi:MAG TPA: flagellar type III secretion system pore protein FliP [Chromatiaceae bacterium]|nr:flagellar type III secretion system pore protein FliP [Chromatiaceae bacterium]HIB85105.1 flagellar type III secretion system pore protein FliP [Chromatiaceae bacterium]HIN82676.1 flagellar biosynthesis protein FliP [Chromatiales bacterium]HIO14953.1 flagellar biosynthesis protein FliP [Chromatiales bacterium]HIO53736.1 flagellar biosynthesis protein FliP [Chromatiales bacterium]
MRSLPNPWMSLLAMIGAMLMMMGDASANGVIEALTISSAEDGSQTYSLTLQVLALMTALTMLPAAILLMTSFTRIIVVLAILRQALGTQQTPNNQVLIGLALFLTMFVMLPVTERVYNDAVQPYLEEQIELPEALELASKPFRSFMLNQTRESDLMMFAEISGEQQIQTPEDVPFSVLVSAFATSELKTAFQIGFLVFLPFLVIDLVVASILMSMGMMMLSPMIISLPFKLMLFVLVDGWSLIMGTLAASFFT